MSRRRGFDWGGILLVSVRRACRCGEKTGALPTRPRRGYCSSLSVAHCGCDYETSEALLRLYRGECHDGHTTTACQEEEEEQETNTQMQSSPEACSSPNKILHSFIHSDMHAFIQSLLES